MFASTTAELQVDFGGISHKIGPETGLAKIANTTIYHGANKCKNYQFIQIREILQTSLRISCISSLELPTKLQIEYKTLRQEPSNFIPDYFGQNFFGNSPLEFTMGSRSRDVQFEDNCLQKLNEPLLEMSPNFPVAFLRGNRLTSKRRNGQR